MQEGQPTPEQDAHIRAQLRLVTVTYEEGIEVKIVGGWGLQLGGRSSIFGGPSAPFAMAIWESRDIELWEQEHVIIPWHRIVSVRDHGRLP